MRLIHISDIHFKSPDCLNPHLDPEIPYRSALVNDAKNFVKNGEKVDAIFITGDIAYKGAKEEFEVASQWVEELAEAVSCPMEAVFTVPGNHDVDRALCNRTATKNVQAAIARSEVGLAQEQEFRNQLMDATAGHSLFAPMEAYNEFAKHFDCQIYPNSPCWKQDMVFEGQLLRIHGLTSTFLSGYHDADNGPGKLYLSPLQTVLNPEEGVINLVLGHHPPNWFLDCSEIEGKLNSRAKLQFFGHEHNQRIEREANYVRFRAGAVNPERYEPAWKPGYNIVDLRLIKSGKKCELDIKAHLRSWQDSPERFVPVFGDRNENYFSHSIDLPDLDHENNIEVFQATNEPDILGELDSFSSTVDEAVMVKPNTRNLIYRFWKLRTSAQREIINELGLVADEDRQLAVTERYSKALSRASELNLINELAQKIEQKESSQ